MFESTARSSTGLAIATFFFSLLLSIRPANSQDHKFPERIGKEIHITEVMPHPPHVDGKLDDAAWQNAVSISDFVQKDPIEKAAPTESTVVYLSYDSENLYIAMRAFDSEPDKIIGRLGRRDAFNDSDWLWFSVDSRYDHQTGFGFAINPVGVKVDMVHYDDVQDDLAWDGVWDSGTSIDDFGWSAEFRIPMSMLRFSQDEVQTWGIQFGRTIFRKRENDWWVLRPRGASGYVSRFGVLHGLRSLQAPRKLEILPYSVARADVSRAGARDENDYRASTGLDLKYGLTTASTIEATINPDFGQVEADPAVLNLTVYETFFPERRPFFIEGANLFKTPFLLFHSRRIGRAPGQFRLLAGDEEISRPDVTTIAGAAKWLGKLPNGLAYGVLAAITTREYANVTDLYGMNQPRLIEPAAGHGVLRVTKDFAGGNSYAGGIATAERRGHNGDDAYTGGVDWNWFFRQNIYQFSGQLIASHLRSASNGTNGWGAKWDVRKRGGRHVQWSFAGTALNEDLDFNDLGFMRRNNHIQLDGRLAYLLPDPNKVTRTAEFAIEVSRASRFNDGLKLGNTYSLSTRLQFLNYYWLSLGADFNESVFDDLDSRGGPPIIKPRASSYWAWTASDSRKSISASLSGYYGSSEAGNRWHIINMVLNAKLSDNILFSLQPGYSFNKNVAQWIDNIDDEVDGLIDHYVYGTLHSNVIDMTTRADFTFRPNLSVQLYMQPFIAVGAYEKFKELTRPKSFDFRPYAYKVNRDFNLKSLNSNLVVRWEYRPGSTIFLVWQQQRYSYDHPGELNFFRDLDDLFRASGNHIFLLKASFWLNI
jgi:hypothetical protein